MENGTSVSPMAVTNILPTYDNTKHCGRPIKAYIDSPMDTNAYGKGYPSAKDKSARYFDYK